MDHETAAIIIQYRYKKYKQKINDIDSSQLDYLNSLYEIFNENKEFIYKNFEDFTTNFFKMDRKNKEDMKGSPVDRHFEMMIQKIINKYNDYLGITYEMYNDLFVPDIVEI